jgi:cytochrome b6
MKTKERVSSWLDDRLGVSKLAEFASHKTVPVHRYSVFYYLGGMTLFFFLVQVCTGILLMLYYRPSAEEAFESIEFLMTTVPFGWLIRSIHSWSANLMVFFAFLHMASVFFMKAYRPPRELTWVTGVLVFFLVLGFGFSGYLLPWNQLAFFATKVGTDIAGVVPIAGPWVMRFLRGGDRVTGGTLSRFYGWHVAILPAITVVLLGLHLLFVQLKGMSTPPAVERETSARKPMKFFPHFALRDLTGWVIALGVLAALAALFPWELGEKADAFAPAYENIRPEWYYVFMFQTLKFVPGGEIFHVEYEALPILFFSLCGLVLLLVPFLDRKVMTHGKSRLFDAAGVVALIFIVAMTCWGYKSLLPLYIVIATAALLGLLAWATHHGGGNGRSVRIATLGAVVLLLIAAVNANAAPPVKTSCVSCHTSEMFDAAAQAKLKHFGDDVHAKLGLSCHDCHGGNPDPRLAEDPMGAMDPAYKPNPYVGKPERTKIPDFCGKCHASAMFMKRFNPDARVDVVSEYWTSKHGQQLKTGNANVATCIDCHGVHGILQKTNIAAPIYPTHVAETCGRCHANERARWQPSVHANALLVKGDLSAPTCNDCHGNHGAAPPGVESVAFICGNCHGREAELFRKSAKFTGFQQHNELLATGAKCADCHEGKPAAKIALHQFSECVTCHENHGVVRPTVALLGNLPSVPCAFCHEGSGPLANVEAEPAAKREHYRRLRDGLLAAAKAQGLDGDARFDWLVDQAQQLPTHVIEGPAGKKALRPEFARLFEKFRIGKTHYTYVDPVTKKTIAVAVRRCNDCHDENSTPKQYLAGMSLLTGLTARAERVLLHGKRGGVEVRAQNDLDAAIDSQIELEVLVHSFDAKGAFAEKQKEGVMHASAALNAGTKALGELSYRRKGLLAALGVIVLVLGGLIMKIRELGS